MGAGAFEDDAGFIYTIDQKPVWFDVAFPPGFEIAGQNMIPAFSVKVFFLNQLTNDAFDTL